MLKTSIRTMMFLAESIFDIIMNKNGEVLFTQLLDATKSPICILLYSGELKTGLDHKLMRLLALHFNKDDELVCSLCEQGSPVPLHDFSVWQVVVFGINYKRKLTFEFGANGEGYFCTQGISVQTPKMSVISLIGKLKTR